MFDKTEILVPLDKYEKEVLQYEQGDMTPGKIIFYGSSAFTRWSKKWKHSSLAEDIRAKDGSEIALNHGIGGSTVEEQLYYYQRLVKAFKPKALVFCGLINDYASGYGTDEIIFMFKRLIEYARTDIPGIKFYLCDIHLTAHHIGEKNTPWCNYRDTINDFVRKYCVEHNDCTHLPTVESHLFFDSPEKAGNYDNVRTDIFIKDKIHFTQEGYNLFGKFFRTALDDIL